MNDQTVRKFILELQPCITSPNKESLNPAEPDLEGYILLFAAIENFLVKHKLTPVYHRTLSLQLPDWFVMVNGHSFEVVCGSTIVPPYTIYVSRNGIPAALINPFKLIILNNSETSEIEPALLLSLDTYHYETSSYS